MTPVGYMISVTASPSNRQVVQTVLKLAGAGQTISGLTTESISAYLFVTTAGTKSTQELTIQLQAAQDFSKVTIVSLSKPINRAELSEVREIFAGLNWDASNVSEDELSLFLNDKLLGQYTYYIDLDLDHRKYRRGPIPMRIKRLEDHPQFSPDWLIDTGRKKEEIQDGESADDIETHESLIEGVEKEEVIPPAPPPPAPTNLKEMSDIQIRHWIRENDTRILKDEDIEIKRSSDEILITIMVDEGEESIIYKLAT